MKILKWDDIPEDMKNESVYKYYEILKKRRLSLLAKRVFDLSISLMILVILLPIALIICILIKRDSRGAVLFTQQRVTQYGKKFRIFKFRTMVSNADVIGNLLTTKDDVRVTKVGHFLRKYRLDEIPQIINIILGDMTFVGTRPEVEKYVQFYTDEMKATLLLPAGLTSEASIQYVDEEGLLSNAENVDKTYVDVVLPKKMQYNLKEVEKFSFLSEIKIIIKTALVVARKRKNIKTSVEKVAIRENEVRM